MTKTARRIRPALISAVLAIFVPPACISDGGTDSNTHWLEPCESNDDCGMVTCICGLCTAACDSDQACGDFSPWARCEALSHAACAESAVPRACVAPCDTADDCPRDDLTCADGQCVRPVADAGAVGHGDAAYARDATSDALGGGAGESGASGGDAGGTGGIGGNGGTVVTGGSAGSAGAAPGGAAGDAGSSADAGRDAEDDADSSNDASAPDADPPAFACAADFAVHWGDTAVQSARDLTLDSEGNTVVAGYYDGTLAGLGTVPYLTVDPPAGTYDGFVTKLGADGNALWRVKLGSPSGGSQYARALAIDQNDDVVVGGSFKFELVIDGVTHLSPGGLSGEDAFVARLSKTDGAMLELHHLGGLGDQSITDVAVDPVAPHALVAVGDFDTEIDCSDGTTPATCLTAGDRDFFVAKMWDPSTRKVWTYGGLDAQWALGMDVDSMGTIALTGRFRGSFSFGGGTPTLTSVIVVDPALTDAYAARLALPALPTGAPTPIFARAFLGGGCADPSRRAGTTIAFDRTLGTSGNVWVGGDYTGCIDVNGTRHDEPGQGESFLLRLDHTTGAVTAERYLTGPSYQHAANLAVDDAGFLFLAGSSRGTVAFDELGDSTGIGMEDTFILRMDPSGAYTWLGRWGGGVTSFTGNPHVGVRTVGAETLLAVGGNLFGTVDFGGGKTITDTGASDAFAARMTCVW